MGSTGASPFGAHHARFGKYLNGTVDLEIAVGDDEFSFFQTISHQVVLSGPQAQNDFATLVSSRLIRHGHVNHGTFSRNKGSACRNYEWWSFFSCGQDNRFPLFRKSGAEDGVDEHFRFQFSFGVHRIETDLHGSGLRV